MHGDLRELFSREWIRALAILLSATIGLQILFAWLKRAWRSRTMRLRMERAIDGENAAISLLDARGFEITGAQARESYILHVDGEPVVIDLRADYLVRKNGARFVAEVKTGALAPRIETAATRRQLLEYELAFDVEGVLLIDAEARRIHEIRFPKIEKRAPARSYGAWILVSALVAAVIVLAQK